MGRRDGLLGWLLVALVVMALPAAAAPGGTENAPGRLVPRTIIGLYETSSTRDWREHRMHQMVEMPLNHLGLLLEPHDVNRALPDLRGRADIRGVLTWLDGTLTDPAAYAAWLKSALDLGLPVTIFGDLGFIDHESERPPSAKLVEDLLRGLRLRPVEQAYDPLYRARATIKTSAMVEYERKLSDQLAVQAAVTALDPAARVYLRVEGGNLARPADLVFTAPSASYVAPGYTHYSVESSIARAWFIDPFLFLAEAFDTASIPKPDVSTLVGRRVYFSHVDGDGWRNWPRFEPYRSRHRYAVDVIMDKSIEPYPDLPVTMAPIAADLDPAWCGDDETQAAARRMFAMPQVEAASHTYSHPFFWRVFDRGSPRNEPIGPVGCGGSPLGVARAYRKQPYDLDMEITGAARLIERYLPPGKRVELLQWSGDTDPSPAVLKAVADVGMLNINGGDSRFDGLYGSVSWVPALGVDVEGQRRVYAVGSNENTYTNLWTSQFYGFGMLRETLARTETPRRLKPINVYYHIYSGERLASLNALIANLEYARAEEIAPVWTSTYVRMVEGFYRTRLVDVGDHAWRIEDRGALQTLRFDAAGGLEIDLERSSGVIGWRRHQGNIYVALDPAIEAPVVVTRPVSAAAVPQARPFLIDSRWPVGRLQWDDGGFSFEAGGFGSGEMRWQVAAPGEYDVVASPDAPPRTVRVAGDGILYLDLDLRDPAPRLVSVRRKSQAAAIGGGEDGPRAQ